VGKDVKGLQQLLIAKGYLEGTASGALDAATVQAVGKFQAARALEPTGVVDRVTLQQLAGFVRIDRAKHKLYLYKEGKLVKTYSVAVGMKAYPTPTGYFSIIVKEKNPTWNPPNSAWAKGQTAIGPGPNNPLGTRWMGLSADSVGIHGTPNPETIGTSASHGCIRMRISDAEDLFDRVVVGTQVEIFD
jgi:lipoprotein-anchoring transpeptidase ErfK/SrfK